MNEAAILLVAPLSCDHLLWSDWHLAIWQPCPARAPSNRNGKWRLCSQLQVALCLLFRSTPRAENAGLG